MKDQKHHKEPRENILPSCASEVTCLIMFHNNKNSTNKQNKNKTENYNER